LSKKQNNILINNVVPLNNGDVALFKALYDQLLKKGYSVKIATYFYKDAKKLYPNLPFVKELGDSKLFFKLHFLKPFLLPFFFMFSSTYRKSDVIIGAPGGYINSNYNIKNSLSVFKIAKYFGKKTIVYSQSVGPLNNKDKRFFKKMMNRYIDFIFVRDSFSKAVLKDLNIPKKKYRLTNDAAFLLKPNLKTSKKTNKIAVSVRAWNFDNRNIDKYKKLMSELVKLAIDKNFEVDFLSTCQGLKYYKNDAIIAQEIYNQLPLEYKSKTKVLRDYFSFDEFYNKLDDYDFVIGTRLHMCIVSMTKMIPAFNISYEVKGKECFDYLEIPDYSIDYNESLDQSIKAFKNFINKQYEIKKYLKNSIPKAHQSVKSDFDYFITKVLND
jgi:polysaccharide pyruvyl transferase WcaK-like protein